jgi:hypothetical protein
MQSVVQRLAQETQGRKENTTPPPSGPAGTKEGVVDFTAAFNTAVYGSDALDIDIGNYEAALKRHPASVQRPPQPSNDKPVPFEPEEMDPKMTSPLLSQLFNNGLVNYRLLLHTLSPANHVPSLLKHH